MQTTTTAQDRLNQYVAAQTTPMLLSVLATLEDAAETPAVKIQLLAVQNEIESRFTPAQNDRYETMLDTRWDEIAGWTQARVYTEILDAPCPTIRTLDGDA